MLQRDHLSLLFPGSTRHATGGPSDVSCPCNVSRIVSSSGRNLSPADCLGNIDLREACALFIVRHPDRHIAPWFNLMFFQKFRARPLDRDAAGNPFAGVQHCPRELVIRAGRVVNTRSTVLNQLDHELRKIAHVDDLNRDIRALWRDTSPPLLIRIGQ